MSTNPTSARTRRPAGTPVGGQFAPEEHAEPEVTLGALPAVTSRLPAVGDPTPWGDADNVERVSDGMCWVTTPGHGGLFVADEVNQAIDPIWRVDVAYSEETGDALLGGWYEEDLDWAIPVVTFPDQFPIRTVLSAHGALQRWNQESYQGARGIRRLEDNEYGTSITQTGLECRSADGKLHSRDQAAVQFRDGTSAWYVHGMRVPAPGSVTLSDNPRNPSVGEVPPQRLDRLDGIAREMAPFMEPGPEYDRSVTQHVRTARLHLDHRDIDGAEHELVLARQCAGHLTADEAVAYDPFNWPDGSFARMAAWISDPVGASAASQ